MNYKVRLPRPVRQRVAGLGFSEEFQLELYKTIRDLLRLSPPEAIGQRVVAPMRFLVVFLTVPCPERNTDLTVTLWIDDIKEPGVRIVKDIAYRDRNLPAPRLS